MLWELSVSEQRYRAVLEVMAGVPVTEVADRYGVSRQSVHSWLRRNPGRLGASLEEFVGHPAYGTGQLRGDLDRFTFLLGGSDGEPLFGPEQQE